MSSTARRAAARAASPIRLPASPSTRRSVSVADQDRHQRITRRCALGCGLGRCFGSGHPARLGGRRCVGFGETETIIIIGIIAQFVAHIDPRPRQASAGEQRQTDCDGGSSQRQRMGAGGVARRRRKLTAAGGDAFKTIGHHPARAQPLLDLVESAGQALAGIRCRLGVLRSHFNLPAPGGPALRHFRSDCRRASRWPACAGHVRHPAIASTRHKPLSPPI